MHLKSKNTESHVKVGQSDPREESNDPSKFVEIARELARGPLLLRDQHEFTRGTGASSRSNPLKMAPDRDKPGRLYRVRKLLAKRLAAIF
jgi:hypothetical protein